MERGWPQTPASRCAAQALSNQVDRQALVQDSNRASMGSQVASRGERSSNIQTHSVAY
jgi:hypothetical protein